MILSLLLLVGFIVTNSKNSKDSALTMLKVLIGFATISSTILLLVALFMDSKTSQKKLIMTTNTIYSALLIALFIWDVNNSEGDEHNIAFILISLMSFISNAELVGTYKLKSYQF